MVRKILCGFALSLLCSCAEKQTEAGNKIETRALPQWQPPAAGTVVAQYQKRIGKDKLNVSYFKVEMISTDNSKAGEYLMKFAYGYNANEKTIELPKWTGNTVLKPVIKEGLGDYACLVGFEANDNQFHELYEVKAINNDVSVKQTRGYYQAK